MGKYSEDSKKLLEYIGGKENIKSVSHCVTRMRFVLIDESKADVSKIEELKSVKGSFTQAGQFQVIIGNEVDLFYNDFTKVSGVEGVTKEQVKADAKSNQSFLQRLMTNLAEIFAPIIPAIVVGGLILGFRNILEGVKMFTDSGAFDLVNGTKTITNMSVFWNGVNHFLWLPGEAIFHFLPVGITWSVTRKMGTTQILGIVLGITLVSPQLLNAYGAAGALAEGKVPFWDFGFAQVNMIGYQAQVIPAMLAGFALAYLEKFFKKIIPDVVQMIFVPFFSLLISIVLAHLVLGPIGWQIGKAISSVVYTGLTSSLNWLFAAVFGFFYSPLVITGLHHMTNAIDLTLINETTTATQQGTTLLWPMIALSNIAQGAAVAATVFLNRRNEKFKEVAIPAWISAWLGVTEPAMFGVNIKLRYSFLAAMIGSSIAGLFSVVTNTGALAIGVGGIPGILSFPVTKWPTFIIAMLIAIIVPVVLTVIFSKRVKNK
ncbi:PTS system trehalose-specific EIIBC component [Helcococcus ovis]|uniref:PTS trehalose transporter subunit IIBC n=1 Tax=Helcococcus ovis TaxID=72026 RepID=A0A4R9C347_9FIRM|nr:PTS system trehalose-specific EIIBC component [Helcococcus ovis]TFF65560.1 PTS trehalose transporter subunit IIBC [Helcococcus ovis]TFF67664.1 PTS trehalose transporter subunit IIBC [Helcococcus ovis]